MKYCTVEEIYERDKNLRKEDVQLIEEWLSKQSHLPKLSEMKIIIFLHSCYYKIEPTKACIENFCTLGAHWKEFWLNRNANSNEIKQALQTGLCTVLPIRTKQNHAVVYTRLMDTRVEVYDYFAQLKAFDMLLWSWVRSFGPPDGWVIIMDAQGATFGHILRVNLVSLKKHMYYVQEAAPIRLKGINIINMPSLADKFLALIRPFTKKNMLELIHFFSKIEDLYDYVPKEALPNEYGGKAGTLKELHEKQMKIVEEQAESFRYMENDFADESKRQGKPTDLYNTFGIEGTFKKLDID